MAELVYVLPDRPAKFQSLTGLCEDIITGETQNQAHMNNAMLC